MSSGFWRTDKRIEPFELGKTTTSRAKIYVKEWQARCYDDIPDEVSDGLMNSGRVPSYKAIAIAVLKNDLQLGALGFGRTHTHWYDILKKIEIDERDRVNTKQLSFCLTK